MTVATGTTPYFDSYTLLAEWRQAINQVMENYYGQVSGPIVVDRARQAASMPELLWRIWNAGVSYSQITPSLVSISITGVRGLPMPTWAFVNSETRSASGATWNEVGVSPRWFNYVESRLGDLERFVEEPDIEAYPKPPLETIQTARSLALTWFAIDTPTPSVVPSEEGGVQYVWHKGGWDFEITVERQGTVVWAHNIRDGESWSGSLDECGSQVARVLDCLGRLRDLSGAA